MGQTIDRARSKKGFTLIELMIVVAIVAFVTAAVVPSMGMSLLRGRQREAANLVVQGVLGARSLAARTGRCHRLTILLSATGEAGGNGGAATIETATQAGRCSVAAANNVWNTISVKCVGCDGHNILAAVRAGLVGDDVALSTAQDIDGAGNVTQNHAAGDSVVVLFEPTGGMFQSRRVVVEAIGAPISRWVSISAGGSVRYGNR